MTWEWKTEAAESGWTETEIQQAEEHLDTLGVSVVLVHPDVIVFHGRGAQFTMMKEGGTARGLAAANKAIDLWSELRDAGEVDVEPNEAPKFEDDLNVPEDWY